MFHQPCMFISKKNYLYASEILTNLSRFQITSDILTMHASEIFTMWHQCTFSWSEYRTSLVFRCSQYLDSEISSLIKNSKVKFCFLRLIRFNYASKLFLTRKVRSSPSFSSFSTTSFWLCFFGKLQSRFCTSLFFIH
jgi:hypothetical protein